MIKLFLVYLFLIPSSFASESYEIRLPNGLSIDAEVAKDKRRGLQGREALCNNCGMIFIFEKEGFQSFWMKDTLINLALLWINKQGEIVYIVENAEPCLGKKNPHVECKVYSPERPAKYVLEINPNAASGVRSGMRVESIPSLWY